MNLIWIERHEKYPKLHDNKIRIARDTIIPPKLDQAVEIQPIHSLSAQVYTDNISCSPYKLCRLTIDPKTDHILFVSNLSDKPIELKKGVVLGHWNDISKNDQVIEVNNETEINPKLSRYQRRRFERMLKRHEDKIFSKKPIKYDPNEKPVRSKPYTTPYHMKEVQDKEIKDQKENNIIRNSKSSWASPIVMVLKPDGSYRFCVNQFLK